MADGLAPLRVPERAVRGDDPPALLQRLPGARRDVSGGARRTCGMIGLRSTPAAGADVSDTFHNVEVEFMEAPRWGVVLSGDLDLADAEAVHRLLAGLARDAAPPVDLRASWSSTPMASGPSSAPATTPSGPEAGSRSARATGGAPHARPRGHGRRVRRRRAARRLRVRGARYQ